MNGYAAAGDLNRDTRAHAADRALWVRVAIEPVWSGHAGAQMPACSILVFSDQDAEQAALAAGADRYLGKAAGFAAAAQAAAELAGGAR